MLHSVLKMFVILDERQNGKIKKGRNPGVKKNSLMRKKVEKNASCDAKS